MKKMMILCKNRYFSVQKAIIYYTFNKSTNILYFILMVDSRDASIYYSVPMLILYPALSISAYLALESAHIGLYQTSIH